MPKLREIDGVILLVTGKKDDIIGCVERISETQWIFLPLVPGVTRDGPSEYVPLRYALRTALSFEPSDKTC